MADIHVLDRITPTQWRIAFHFPVAAAAANNAGILYRNVLAAAIAADLLQATQLPIGDGTAGTVSSVESAQLIAGERIERIVTVEAESGGATAAQMLAHVRQVYARTQTDVTADMTRRFAWFGGTFSAS